MKPRQPDLGLALFATVLTLGVVSSTTVAQETTPDASKRSAPGSVYAKVILPIKPPADGQHPLVESWIAKKLRKRGETELRAVTEWIRLAEKGEEVAFVWNATVDGRTWGCPVVGRVVERTADGNVKVTLDGWAPVALKIKGTTLPAETGSRRIAVVDDGRAYAALFIGPPASAAESSHPKELQTDESQN